MSKHSWLKSLTLLSLLSVSAAQAQNIATGGIFNNGFIYPGLDNAPVARGALFIIYLDNPQPALPNASASLGTFPLPTTTGGVSGKVTVGSTTVDLIIWQTSSGNKIDAMLPSRTPEGTGTVTITYNGRAGAPAPITVVRRNWQNYTLPENGSGPGIVTNTSFQVFTPTAAANPGEAAILWGSGAGPVTADDTTAPRPGNLDTTDVSVIVGGQNAQIIGLSRSSAFAGLDQLAFFVPNNVTGCYVSVFVRIGTIYSNSFTMPIAARGRTCSDPNGFSESDLNKLTAQGFLRVGSLDLTRSISSFSVPGLGSFDSTTDSGSGLFYRYDAATFSRSRGTGDVSLGSCQVFYFRGDAGEPVDPYRTVYLNAGPAINISGPNGAKQMTRKSDGTYSADLGGGTAFPGGPAPAPLYLSAGNYTMNNGSGGSDVGSFTVQMAIPTPLNWTNRSSITTITRSSGQTVTWTGGDPTGFVTIFGFSSRENPTVGAVFICTAPVSAGQFTVPASVLMQLPASSGDTGGALSLAASTKPVSFTANGLDVGYAASSVSSFILATYR
jgi:uncharacterized protein (TIGR03437 family)